MKPSADATHYFKKTIPVGSQGDISFHNTYGYNLAGGDVTFSVMPFDKNGHPLFTEPRVLILDSTKGVSDCSKIGISHRYNASEWDYGVI